MLQRADRMNSRTLAAGQVLKKREQKKSFPFSFQPVCMYVDIKTKKPMLSYHYLEHRAEDLGVLCHTTDVELP